MWSTRLEPGASQVQMQIPIIEWCEMRETNSTALTRITKEEGERLRKGLAAFRNYKPSSKRRGGYDASGHPMGHSVRKAQYKGHDIEVHAQYEFLLDGKPLKMHIEVANDGTVHCHGLPNYGFASSVEMMKKIIDVFSRDLPKDELNRSRAKPKATKKKTSERKSARKKTPKKTTKRKR